MTVVVALRDERYNSVYLGADSAGVSGSTLVQRIQPKVFPIKVKFKRGVTFSSPSTSRDMLIAYTSSFRMGDLLRVFEPTVPSEGKDMDTYLLMVKHIVPQVRELFSNNGFMGSDDEDREKTGTFLVGFDGRIFEIESDLQVGEPLHDYLAEGSGRNFAYGSFTSSTIHDPTSRVKMALRAAETHCTSVKGPMKIYVLANGRAEELL